MQNVTKELQNYPKYSNFHPKNLSILAKFYTNIKSCLNTFIRYTRAAIEVGKGVEFLSRGFIFGQTQNFPLTMNEES